MNTTTTGAIQFCSVIHDVYSETSDSEPYEIGT